MQNATKKTKIQSEETEKFFPSIICIKGATKFQTKVIFVSATKNRRKHNQHFKTAVFHNKFTLCHIKPNIYIQKTKFSSNKQYLSRLFTSRNAKKTKTDESISRVFLPFLKGTDPQTFSSGSCKKPFLECVYYWYNLLR